MLFGKVSENVFNMDVALPLSPFIAFGVALASFDEKFFCEWSNKEREIHFLSIILYKLMILHYYFVCWSIFKLSIWV